MRRRLAAASALLAVAAAPPAPRPPWWSGASIYEVYPRSFQDSDGDGLGDLAGIAQRLDHFTALGVDAIWIAPFFPSPDVDFGYDIADYRAVDPKFGTMADFDRLLAQAKARNLRVVMDMVLNHTSDRHAWFVESASSRDNDKAGWYVWNDGMADDAPGVTAFQRANAHDGRVPPNNWTSLFGGSAWEWVPQRRQFYYHRFYRQQPDLDWRNPAVEKAMFDVMRFWLDRGVAGFRLDAIPSMFEDAQNRSEPETGGTDAYGAPNLDHRYTDNLDEVHATIRRLRAMVDGYQGRRVLIGETYLPDTASLDRWYGGTAKDELHLAMDMLPGFGAGARYAPAHFRPLLEQAQTRISGAMPLLVFDNHDQRRSIDRFGDGAHDVAIAKGVAAILYASRATALTYYWAEIGMRTATPTRRDDVRDPIGIAGWPREKGRDGQRTPMQWTAGAQAGFSTDPKTWLPVNPDHATINFEREAADPQSLYAWYRRLNALRNENAALRDGTMRMAGSDAQVLAWVRAAPGGGAPVLVAINMGAAPRTFAPATLDGALKGAPATLAASEGATAAGARLTLPPYATWIGTIGR